MKQHIIEKLTDLDKWSMQDLQKLHSEIEDIIDEKVVNTDAEYAFNNHFGDIDKMLSQLTVIK